MANCRSLTLHMFDAFGEVCSHEQEKSPFVLGSWEDKRNFYLLRLSYTSSLRLSNSESSQELYWPSESLIELDHESQRFSQILHWKFFPCIYVIKIRCKVELNF